MHTQIERCPGTRQGVCVDTLAIDIELSEKGRSVQGKRRDDKRSDQKTKKEKEKEKGIKGFSTLSGEKREKNKNQVQNEEESEEKSKGN